MQILRQKLFEMTEVSDVSLHPSLLAEITLDCPNGITVLESAYPIERYACLVHALDLTGRPEYEAIARRRFRNVFAGVNFAHWLLEAEVLVEVPLVDSAHLVFYFDADGNFKHAGMGQESGQVRSKWGIGHLYEHGLFEVPASYDDS